MQQLQYDWKTGEWRTYAMTGFENYALQIEGVRRSGVLAGYEWSVGRLPGGFFIFSSDMGEGLLYPTPHDAMIACENYFNKHVLPTVDNARQPRIVESREV